MPTPINNLAASQRDKTIQTFVRGSLLTVINNNGFPTGDPIRDKNIQLFWQDGYEAKQLVNTLTSHLVGLTQINIDFDTSAVEVAVQNNWNTIFSLTLP